MVNFMFCTTRKTLNRKKITNKEKNRTLVFMHRAVVVNLNIYKNNLVINRGKQKHQEPDNQKHIFLLFFYEMQNKNLLYL